MEVANGQRDCLKVYGNDYNTKDGTCVRDYIHVLDLASAHIKALDYLEENDSTAINLSTGKGYSILDIIKITKKITDQEIPYSFSPKRKGDPPISISTFNKAKELLDWNPKYSIDDIKTPMKVFIGVFYSLFIKS